MRGRSFARLIGLSLVAALLAAVPARAQEGQLAADFRREGGHVAEKCQGVAPKAILGCAMVLITDHPLHLSIGSIAPGNGFAFGLAFVPPQWNPNDDWRIRWSADAVATPAGAWRAGAYVKFVSTRMGDIVVARPGEGTPSEEALPRPYPTLTAHAQVTSLPAVSYFGLGPDSALDGRSAFSLRQTSLGARAFWPIARSSPLRRLNAVAIGEVAGRWVRIGNPTHGTDPSITALYTDETAPGLDAQPATMQLSEGIRIAPALGRLQLTYTGRLQQFVAPSDGTASFRRWALDLRHEFGLWSTSRAAVAREANTPNECTTGADRTVTAYGCPDPTIITTNRNGTIGLRVFVSRASASDDGRVPFYFQPTIGGADIDGERRLASYEDYRFRAPGVLVLQATIEHVIWGPIGAFGSVEQGRVALAGESLTDGGFRRTYGAGLSLRAGGMPMATLWWATGGTEGSRVVFLMNTSLFGGSPRPSLQ
jgi:hypothetical protein